MRLHTCCVRLHEQLENTDGMRGSEIALLVGGSWSTYRSYIVRYLRQMAVITPYARFRLTVGTLGERSTLALECARRQLKHTRTRTRPMHAPCTLALAFRSPGG